MDAISAKNLTYRATQQMEEKLAELIDEKIKEASSNCLREITLSWHTGKPHPGFDTMDQLVTCLEYAGFHIEMMGTSALVVSWK